MPKLSQDFAKSIRPLIALHSPEHDAPSEEVVPTEAQPVAKTTAQLAVGSAPKDSVGTASGDSGLTEPIVSGRVDVVLSAAVVTNSVPKGNLEVPPSSNRVSKAGAGRKRGPGTEPSEPQAANEVATSNSPLATLPYEALVPPGLPPSFSQELIALKSVDADGALTKTDTRPAKGKGHVPSVSTEHIPKSAEASRSAIPTVAEAEPTAVSTGIPCGPQSTGLGYVIGSVDPVVPVQHPIAASISAPVVHSNGVNLTSELGNTPGASAIASQSADLRTLVATPNVLEVGIASGSHGWLRVRAEFGQAGQVAASVMASSANAAEGLHRELPALNAFLAGEHVGVGTLIVNASDKGGTATGPSISPGVGADPSSQPGSNKRGKTLVGEQGRRGDTVSTDTLVDSGMVLGNLIAPAIASSNGSGNWLSVRV